MAIQSGAENGGTAEQQQIPCGEERQKSSGRRGPGARRGMALAAAGLVAAALLIGTQAQGQTDTTPSGSSPSGTSPSGTSSSGTAGIAGQAPRATPRALGKIAVAAPVTYNNRYEIYGGLNFMNFQAGQALPNRMNLGGGELMATYWLNRRLGIAADYRGEAGTTPVFPQANVYPYYIVRPLVYMNAGLGGVQYRGPKNQFAAVNYHALFGVSHGTFDSTQKAGQPNFGPAGFFTQTGLYTNRTKPMFALGGSLDINRSKNFAIRLSPDLIIEHFGTETREFFAVSGGVIYRFGRVR
ncbi:MAG: hypothetical protein M3Y50_12620 [Acidobacteriota bacterium]|nr:hypothetical protein [Acidobacteriota bacterium]